MKTLASNRLGIATMQEQSLPLHGEKYMDDSQKTKRCKPGRPASSLGRVI